MKDLEDDEREFFICVYIKVELVLFYVFYLFENVVFNNFSCWMWYNKFLMVVFEEVGYYKYCYLFMFKEVCLIF